MEEPEQINEGRVSALMIYLRGETEADIEEALRRLEDEPELEPSKYIEMLQEWQSLTWWGRLRRYWFLSLLSVFFSVFSAICAPFGMIIGGSLTATGGFFILSAYFYIAMFILRLFGIESEQVMDAITALFEWIETWKETE